MDRLLIADRYALDTEFHRERTYWPSLALVQVAWPESPAGPQGVALIDPLSVDVAPLCQVLAGPGVMVAHAAEQDLESWSERAGRAPRASSTRRWRPASPATVQPAWDL